VIGRKMEAIGPDDGIVYAGCYVNATIRLWGQDNQYGKRINAQLRAIQFVKKGDAFGDGDIDVMKEFKALDDTDESPI
jgi:hypothetical protein